MSLHPARRQDPRAPAPAPVVAQLAETGWASLGPAVEPAACAAALEGARATRRFDAGLFLSEAAYLADPQHKGVNPRPGRNLAQDLAALMAPIEAAPAIQEALAAILGAGWSILDRKFVCGVAEADIPEWVLARIRGKGVNNLGAYIRPEYRDVTYFWGIDYHQDIIDWPGRTADFITLYVYLHAVTAADAPLFLLPGSHALGATEFPHSLERTGGDGWLYADRRGQQRRLTETRLLGPAGTVGLWHPFTLHGTQPTASDAPRLSLRYLLARGPGAAGLDLVNARVQGPLASPAVRCDLDASGRAAVSGNSITSAVPSDA
jgi:hypothetical protein